MSTHLSILSTRHVSEKLRASGITPTAPRVIIAQHLFSLMEHVSAEEVYKAVNRDEQNVSKATVYNTLGLFVEKGLIREVIADPARVLYDPNPIPHHHFFNVCTGELVDIHSDDLQVTGLPSLPEGMRFDGVEVIIRLRPSNN